MAIFNSYVKLPEGISCLSMLDTSPKKIEFFRAFRIHFTNLLPPRRAGRDDWDDPPSTWDFLALANRGSHAHAWQRSKAKFRCAIFICLVVFRPTPLKNMQKSVGMMNFPIYGTIKNVPNHQPVYMEVSWNRGTPWYPQKSSIYLNGIFHSEPSKEAPNDKYSRKIDSPVVDLENQPNHQQLQELVTCPSFSGITILL